MPGSHASGSLYSTVEDLFKWDQLLRSNDFLDSETKKLMYSPQFEFHPGAFSYGWFIDTVRISNSVQTRMYHAGDVSGFCALYVRVLESGDFVALLSNQEGLNYYDIAFSLLDLLNGVTPEPPKEYLSDLMRSIYFTSGIEALKTEYSSIRTSGFERFKIVEDEIIELGYDILTTGDTLGALDVFEINVELHPDSPNAYYARGEGFLIVDNLDKALSDYEKSLQLNPDNVDIIKKIESILEKQKH